MDTNRKLLVAVFENTSYQKALKTIERMNIEDFSKCLRPGLTYQNMHRDKFLSRMKKAFMKFKTLGESELKTSSGYCTGCRPGNESICFTGPLSNVHMTFLIEKDDLGRITDMYHCASFCPADSNHKLNRLDHIEIIVFPDLFDDE